MGVQWRRLNNEPILLFSLFVELHEEVAPDKPSHQCEHTQNHHQGVVEDKSALHPAHHARNSADQLPASRSPTPPSITLIATLPEAGAQARAPGAKMFSLIQSR